MRYSDFILASISSRVPDRIMFMEMLIEANEITGLIKPSLLILDYVMTIPEDLITRKIGTLTDNDLAEANRKLKKLFGLII